ncbi:MAG: TolC family protein [Burkholderiales bacterium]|nr:TolC family protein [Burkholderiales bacterium]
MNTRKISLAITLAMSIFSPAQAEQTTANEKSIQALISLTLSRNPKIFANNQEKFARQQETQAAEAQFFPTPSASIEKADNRPRLALNERTDNIRIVQPVFTGGRLTAGLERATAAENIANINIESARLTLSEEVIDTVSSLKNAEEKTQVLEKSLKKHSQYLEMVRRRATEGQSSQADVLLAENRWLAVKADLLGLNNEQALQRIRLKQLCQCNNEEIEVTLQHKAMVNPNLEQLEQLSLENSTTLKRIDQELLILQALEKEALSAYSPQVSLRAEHSRGNFTGPDNSVFLNINVSLGAGSSQLRSINAAEFRTQGKYQERDAEAQAVSRTVQSFFQFLETSLQRQALQQSSHESAMAVMLASERLYLSGRKSWQELMNSAREAYQAETLVVDAKISAWQVQQKLLVTSQSLDVYLSQNRP